MSIFKCIDGFVSVTSNTVNIHTTINIPHTAIYCGTIKECLRNIVKKKGEQYYIEHN